MGNKHIAKGFALVLSFVMALCSSVVIGSAFRGSMHCYAVADLPSGTKSGNNFYVRDSIENWNELEGLLGSYNIIYMTYAYVHDNDFSHFVHLGDETGLSLIAKVDCSNPKELYPQKILSAFNTTSKTFLSCHNVKTTSNPGIIATYTWGTTANYVFDKSRNNNITIRHGVVDENGQVLLAYAAEGSLFDAVDITNNTVSTNSINYSEGSNRTIRIKYEDALNGTTTLNGVPKTTYTSPLVYLYQITPCVYSTVKADIDVCVLGNIEVTNQDDLGNPLAGAKYAVYTDVACTTRAKQYSSGAWQDIPTQTTDSDGRIKLVNVRPGTYYIKEASPKDSYKENNEIKQVTVDETNLDLSLDVSSGEGQSLSIFKENILLEPNWNVNCKRTVMSFANESDNKELVTASQYNSGGEVFIKGNGSAVAYNNTADISALESFDKLSSNNISVSVGSINMAFSTPTAAMEYVNNQLITADIIDTEEARDHVTIVGTGELVYCDSSKTASVTFVSDAEDVDVPVTGVDNHVSGLPLVIVAVLVAITLCAIKLGKGLMCSK